MFEVMAILIFWVKECCKWKLFLFQFRCEWFQQKIAWYVNANSIWTKKLLIQILTYQVILKRLHKILFPVNKLFSQFVANSTNQISLSSGINLTYFFFVNNITSSKHFYFLVTKVEVRRVSVLKSDILNFKIRTIIECNHLLIPIGRKLYSTNSKILMWSRYIRIFFTILNSVILY